MSDDHNANGEPEVSESGHGSRRRRIEQFRAALESQVTDPHSLAEGDGSTHTSYTNRDYLEQRPPHHGDS